VPTPSEWPSRRHNEGNAELGRSVLEKRQALRIDKADRRLLAGPQVSDAHGKDVIPFLLQESCRFAIVESLLVLVSGLLALGEHGLDGPAARGHFEIGYSAPARQRKDINRLDGLVVAVDECLAY
jgi:hypothetical protein